LKTIVEARKQSIERLNEAELTHLTSLIPSVGGNLIVIDSGAGQIANSLANYFSEITAVECCEERLAQAIFDAQSEGISNVDFRVLTPDALPFSSSSQSGVISKGSTHSVLAIQGYVSEVYRVLKPGGWLLLEEAINADDVDDAREINRIERIRDGFHTRYLTLEGWKKLLLSMGFQLEYFEVVVKPYNVLSTCNVNLKGFDVSREYIDAVSAARGGLKQYYRVHGEGEIFTFHLHRMLMLVQKPV
jgi:SAM-dependent methyltransferase